MKNNIFMCLLTASLLSSCAESITQQEIPAPATKALYVLNTAARSISVIDLENNTVSNNVATVGTWPNQLVYHKGKVYCVNSRSNNIMIFDADTWQSETPISLGEGHNPMNMVFASDNMIYVACLISEKVLQIDIETKAITRQINAGVGTTGIAATAGKIYISNTAFDGLNFTYGQGTVTVLDAASGDSVSTISVGKNPQSLTTGPDGSVHVVCTGNYVDVPGQINIIDSQSDTVTDTIEIGGSPGSIAISANDGRGYLGVWGLGCLVYDTSDGNVVRGTDNYLLGKGGTGVVTDTESNLYVSVWNEDQVIKIDAAGNQVDIFYVGDSPSSLAVKNE